MIKIEKTDNKNPNFKMLVKELDAYLKITDQEEHSFYNQYNGLETIKHVVVAYDEETPIGCGAFKEKDENCVEIKRMYVKPSSRGTSVANRILTALERWAKEEGNERCILETGIRQVAAIKFYEKMEYVRIPNYGQYIGMENSSCFEKKLK